MSPVRISTQTEPAQGVSAGHQLYDDTRNPAEAHRRARALTPTTTPPAKTEPPAPTTTSHDEQKPTGSVQKGADLFATMNPNRTPPAEGLSGGRSLFNRLHPTSDTNKDTEQP